jgi:ATP-dependent DNA helicase PIF1
MFPINIKIFFRSLDFFIFFVYPTFLQNMKIFDFFQERGILSPTLDAVEHVNEFLLSLVPGYEKEYISSDSVCKSNENNEVQSVKLWI